MNPDNLPQSADQMTDILEIEGFLRSPWENAARVALIAASLLALLLLVYRAYQAFNRRRGATSLPPFPRALKALKSLHGRTFASLEEWAAFYFEVSAIVRRYFTDRFDVDILDKTTEEIASLKNRLAPPMSEGDWERFKRFLAEGDQIKFARQPGTPAQAEEDLRFADALIRSCEDKAPKAASTKVKGKRRV